MNYSLNKTRKNQIIYQGIRTKNGERQYRSYKIEKQIGKGAYGTCYQIVRINDQKVFAMKVLPKTTDQKTTDQKEKYSLIEKIRAEIKILSTLDSPNVVKYETHFQDNEVVFLVMELCPKGTLGQILKKRRFLTEPQVRFFIFQIIDILKYLKSKNILHRDIKLANFLLDKNYHIKIGDFGLSMEINPKISRKSNICGTPNYISPQILQNKHYSFEADLWSAGVVIYTLITGVPPFQTKTKQQTYKKIISCKYSFDSTKYGVKPSEKLKSFLGQILKINPKERLSLEKLVSHPFLSHYQIPKCLQLNFPQSVPSKLFVKTYNTLKISTGIQQQIKTHQFKNDNELHENKKQSAFLKRKRKEATLKPIITDRSFEKLTLQFVIKDENKKSFRKDISVKKKQTYQPIFKNHFKPKSKQATIHEKGNKVNIFKNKTIEILKDLQTPPNISAAESKQDKVSIEAKSTADKQSNTEQHEHQVKETMFLIESENQFNSISIKKQMVNQQNLIESQGIQSNNGLDLNKKSSSSSKRFKISLSDHIQDISIHLNIPEPKDTIAMLSPKKQDIVDSEVISLGSSISSSSSSSQQQVIKDKTIRRKKQLSIQLSQQLDQSFTLSSQQDNDASIISVQSSQNAQPPAIRKIRIPPQQIFINSSPVKLIELLKPNLSSNNPKVKNKLNQFGLKPAQNISQVYFQSAARKIVRVVSWNNLQSNIGVFYFMNTNQAGVVFNDGTIMLISADEKILFYTYIDKKNCQSKQIIINIQGQFSIQKSIRKKYESLILNKNQFEAKLQDCSQFIGNLSQKSLIQTNLVTYVQKVYFSEGLMNGSEQYYRCPFGQIRYQNEDIWQKIQKSCETYSRLANKKGKSMNFLTLFGGDCKKQELTNNIYDYAQLNQCT